jgi:hypothetical protein
MGHSKCLVAFTESRSSLEKRIELRQKPEGNRINGKEMNMRRTILMLGLVLASMTTVGHGQQKEPSREFLIEQYRQCLKSCQEERMKKHDSVVSRYIDKWFGVPCGEQCEKICDQVFP